MWVWMWWLGCTGNTPPEVDGLTISPLRATAADVLVADAAVRDVDGDPVTMRWQWFADGTAIPGATAASLPASGLARGSLVHVEGVPFDGIDAGPMQPSPTATVENTLPSFATARISPAPLTSADVPSCVVEGWQDADGDPEVSDLHWTVDGLQVPDVTAPLPQGTVVACTATPRDDFGSGIPIHSAPVTVANGPPSAVTLTLTPPDPIVGLHDLLCTRTADSLDPDGDPVSYTQTWLADGVPWTGETETTIEPGDTLPAWVTPQATIWTCQGVPRDLVADGPTTAIDVTPTVAGTNVLVLLADDMGNDKVGAYAEHPDPPPTPNIDALAADGVLFRNFYATHGCTPTRASMLTGRHTLRYGLGGIIEPDKDALELPEEELLIPAMLDHSPLPWETALTGKWHLASFLVGSGPAHPGVAGFDWYGGSMENLGISLVVAAPVDYFRWEKVDNGAFVESTVYATDDTVDDAVDRIAMMQEPWLLWVSFNAPHTPLHVPPEPRLTQQVDATSSDLDLVNAMIEDLDLAIGDLLSTIDPAVLDRTTVIFMGDNGTSKFGTAPPWDPDRAKSSIYEAGVNVPLIVRSPLVSTPGVETDALVAAVDVFDTVAAIAGVDVVSMDAAEGVAARDGTSFLPYLAEPSRTSRRDVVYTDKHLPIGAPPYDWYRRAVYDGRFKLHHHQTPTDDWYELYDLEDRVIEGPDLLLGGDLGPVHQEAHDRLLEELASLEAGLAYEY